MLKEAMVSQYESHSSLRNKEKNAKNLSQYCWCFSLDTNFIPLCVSMHFTHRQTYESQNDQGRVVQVPSGKDIFLHSQRVHQTALGSPSLAFNENVTSGSNSTPNLQHTTHCLTKGANSYRHKTNHYLKGFQQFIAFFNLDLVIAVTS